MNHHNCQAAAIGRSTRPKAILVALAMCLACSAVVAAPPREVTDEDIDRAIEQAQRFLWSRLDGGGTLFVNAVGGADAFNRSAGEMLEKLFAAPDVVGRPARQGDAEAGPAAAGSPLVTGKCDDFRGPPLGKFQRTRAWEKTASGAPTMAPLRLYEQLVTAESRRAGIAGQGRAVVIYAPHGVHDTLDGHTAHGAMSYMPPSARDIAANVVLYSLMQKPQ